MNEADQAFTLHVANQIAEWENAHGALPGLRDPAARDSFVRQLVESDRRRRYVELLAARARARPGRDEIDSAFNPLVTAARHAQAGNTDEGLWLVFLAVHFGRHRVAGWRYTGAVYGKLGDGRWDWPAVSTDPTEFRAWLSANRNQVEGTGRHGFGNHRKRESLGDDGTGRVVQSYVDWIGPTRSPVTAFEAITADASDDRAIAFDLLYESMGAVYRFGRLGRFDYLTTAGRLGLINSLPGRPYLPSSSGPLKGARLLFGAAHPRDLEATTTRFGAAVGISFPVLEDALCNWQKSPTSFRRWTG